MKTKKKFNIERVREFCALINSGQTPSVALKNMNSCQGYSVPLKEAGFYWKEKNGKYKAPERIRTDRYLLFTEKKNEYNIKKINKSFVKQPTLFCQPKERAIKRLTVYSEERLNVLKQIQNTDPKIAPPQYGFNAENKLSFIQRIIKSLFKL
jgi:hypothetical protein